MKDPSLALIDRYAHSRERCAGRGHRFAWPAAVLNKWGLVWYRRCLDCGAVERAS